MKNTLSVGVSTDQFSIGLLGKFILSYKFCCYVVANVLHVVLCLTFALIRTLCHIEKEIRTGGKKMENSYDSICFV